MVTGKFQFDIGKVFEYGNSMIQPKYQIGQQVYFAWGGWKETFKTCPDCLGKMEWAVETPIGDKFTIPCGTCMYGYECRGIIPEWGDQPEFNLVTIGSIRMDTGCKKHPISYMCEETGIGSGRIYYEENLFLNKEDAMLAAIKIARELTEQRKLQEEENTKRKKKNHRSKPSLEQRRIRELEKEVKELKKENI